jgi:hypothetical protein
LLRDIRDTEDVKTKEAKDDLILELMDVVAGFCSPSARLW